MALYGQECLPALRLQYKDYAQWQQSPREQEKIAGQKSFWVKEFSTEVIPLELPTDHPRPPIRGEKTGKHLLLAAVSSHISFCSSPTHANILLHELIIVFHVGISIILLPHPWTSLQHHTVHPYTY